MTPTTVLMLLTLSALWGGSFLFLRLASPVLGPVLLIELRVLLAGLALLGYGLATGRLRRPLRWRPLMVVGVLNSAVPFTLIAFAELRLPASVAATINALTPSWSVLASVLWLGAALTATRGLGLLVGVAGVAVLVGLGPLAPTPGVLVSIGASMLAAACYGFAAVYASRRVAGETPLAVATYSQLAAAAALLPLVPFAPARQPVGVGTVATVLALALLCTALAYLLYFGLIARAGATRATTVTYLAPAFGVLWGAIFLGEPLSRGTLLGLALILGGVALTGRGERRAAHRAGPQPRVGR